MIFVPIRSQSQTVSVRDVLYSRRVRLIRRPSLVKILDGGRRAVRGKLVRTVTATEPFAAHLSMKTITQRCYRLGI